MRVRAVSLNEVTMGDYPKNEMGFQKPCGAATPEKENRRPFGRAYKKNNLPHIRFHELRHSCASLLMNQGCSLKDIQEWMGHSDIQTTANIYGHLDTARKQGLADKLSQCLTR